MELNSWLNLDKIQNNKKVFVIGMSKTGTTSMEEMLKKLEYRVCRGHWGNNNTNFLCSCYYHDNIDEIINITRYYDAFADAPRGGNGIV